MTSEMERYIKKANKRNQEIKTQFKKVIKKLDSIS